MAKRQRDARGRLLPMHPYTDYYVEDRQIDGRSLHRAEKDPNKLNVRLPPKLAGQVRMMAQSERISLTNFVIGALIARVQPGIQPQSPFLTDSPSEPKFLGLNSKLPRLVPEAQRDPQNSVPSYDKIGRFRQKAGGRPPPTLTDRGRR
jgi:hypothetical protein